MTETNKEGEAPKSIIPAKYQGKYREKDWLGNFIDQHATTVATKSVKVKGEDGKPTGETEEVETNKRVLDLDAFFALCKANGIDTAKMEEQRDRPNAPGRIRMTLGNSLRAAARRRHGLNTADGEFVVADAEFVDGHEKTETPDGERIAKAPVKEEEPAD